MTANSRGILLMVVSMGLFALGDAFLKLAAGSMSPAQVAFWLILGGATIFTTIAVAQGHRLIDRVFFAPTLVGRYLTEAIGAFGLVSAFALAPLSTTAAILQASPLVVTLVAALFLGETVGWRRWAAVAVGFLGVLLIVQPGTDGFSPLSLYALVGTLGLSLRDVFTRIAPPRVPTIVMVAYTLIAVVPMVGAWCLIVDGTVMPADANWALVAAMVIFGSGGYFALTTALRIAEMSVIAPFRYTRLLFALILGALIFGERPGPVILLGAALILGAGLYAWGREQIRPGRLHSPSRPG